MVITSFVVITITFFMFRIIPGDPVSMLVTGNITIEAQEMIRKAWGLDRPLLEQYFVYLKNIAVGEFGVSHYYRTSVW